MFSYELAHSHNYTNFKSKKLMVSAGATVKNFSRSRGIEVGSILGALSLKQEQKKWFRRFSFSLEFLVVWDKYERSSGIL